MDRTERVRSPTERKLGPARVGTVYGFITLAQHIMRLLVTSCATKAVQRLCEEDRRKLLRRLARYHSSHRNKCRT